MNLSKLSPAERIVRAKLVVSDAPALDQLCVSAADKLLALWPGAEQVRNFEAYRNGIAAVFGKYPATVMDECCDAADGLASVREKAPTMAAVNEWCSARFDLYESIARLAKAEKVA